ncbi:hypothetical protein TNCV_421841 [Trichonephila clavipes]|nr:hypothetical protein TNCV_421841 [Trichonephila clavipes]
MGNLPYERVNMAPPFSITGLDLGGPYFVTYKHQRKGVLNKISKSVAAYFIEEGIEWNFIPPRAPHMGGGHKVSEISPQASTGKIPTHLRGV